MNDLVSRLTSGDHAVAVSIRPEATAQRFKESLDRGFVHIKFTETRGGTELGIRLDRNLSDFKNGNFISGDGEIEIVGTLTLDYEKVRCRAHIDLKTLSGRGYLELADSK